MPERALRRESVTSPALLPMEDTMPKPVTTTRRMETFPGSSHLAPRPVREAQHEDGVLNPQPGLVEGVRSGPPMADEMVLWTISSDERPKLKRRAGAVSRGLEHFQSFFKPRRALTGPEPQRRR